MSWMDRHGRVIGRTLVLLGVVAAGVLAKSGYLPQPDGEWKEFSVQSVERSTNPHRGRMERTYRLKLVDQPSLVLVESDVAGFFDQKLLLSQHLPALVEVLSDGEVHDGVIHAQALRLKDGQWLLDQNKVKAQRRPFELLGAGLCSVLIGTAFLFLAMVRWRGRRRPPAG
jgi:hypothetical protein